MKHYKPIGSDRCACKDSAVDMLLEGQDCPSGDKHAKEEEEFVRQKLPPAEHFAMCQ